MIHQDKQTRDDLQVIDRLFEALPVIVAFTETSFVFKNLSTVRDLITAYDEKKHLTIRNLRRLDPHGLSKPVQRTINKLRNKEL